MKNIPADKWAALSPYARRVLVRSGIVAEPYRRPRSRREIALRAVVGCLMTAMCFGTMVIAWLLFTGAFFGGVQ